MMYSFEYFADLKIVATKITEILHSVLVREDTMVKSFQNSLGAREPKVLCSVHRGAVISFTQYV